VPLSQLTFPLRNDTIRQTGAASNSGTLPAATDATFQINSVQTFKSVAEVPFYVGQPIALWLTAAAPAVAASNYAVITAISLDTIAGAIGQARITFEQYTVGAGDPALRSGGAAITDAEFFANIVAGGAGVCVGMSGVYDPFPIAAAPGNDVLQFNNGTPANLLGAGIASTYQITGLEAVMCELVGQEVAKKSVDYIQYNRDLDTISAGQLYYQKSFMLDPACVALFAVAPCTKLLGQPNRNLWAVSEQAAVVSGVSFRNMLNGMQLYSRDIVFSAATQNVEPLQLDRLEMAYEALGSSLKNTSTTTQLIAQNGTGQHVLIAERVPQSADMQQFQVRINHATNANARTIYVFKAIVKSLDV
jgi:hypothetical protein